MLVKILGAIDFLAGLILLFGTGLLGLKLPFAILLIFGVILLVKSLFGLLKDFASWIDFSSGLVLILSALFTMPFFISVIFAVLIIQKAIFSFF